MKPIGKNIIVKDIDEEVKTDSGLILSGEGSGTAKADGSKYSVVLTAENEALAYEVDPAIIAGLLV